MNELLERAKTHQGLHADPYDAMTKNGPVKYCRYCDYLWPCPDRVFADVMVRALEERIKLCPDNEQVSP